MMKGKKVLARMLTFVLAVTMVINSGSFAFAMEAGDNTAATASETEASAEQSSQSKAESTAAESESSDASASEAASETKQAESAATAEESSKQTTEEATNEEKQDSTEAAASDESTKADEKSTESKAQTLTAQASDGAKVTVKAPAGAFDEDVTLRVKTVSSSSVESAITAQDKNATDIAAYDITIVDKNGKEVQPAKAVSVRISKANLEDTASAVYHVNDDKTTAEAISANTHGKTASFQAEHFSIYVVVGDKPALATYEFYNGDEQVDSQTVKDGETLDEPEAPAKDGYIFSGWYTAATGGQKFDSFGKQAVTTTSTVKLYARYEEAHYAFFMDGTDDDARVIKTKSGVNGTKVSTADVTFAVAGDESITGWYTDKALTQKVDSVTLDSEDVYLYPKVEKGFWVTYTANGGSYTAPEFYSSGSTAKEPTNPTKAGYTFAGWYTDEALTQKANFSNITEDTTLYAKWTAKSNTKYTLVYWIENADDSDYSYDKSVTATGTTGSKITLTEAQKSASNLSDSTHFEYNGTKTTEALSDAIVAGDGSTVVNVYFTRKSYTLHFKVTSTYGSWGGEEVATITAKYNSKISDEFNKAPFNTDYEGRAWQCTDTSKYSYALQTLDRMPGFDATFKLYRQSSYQLKTLTYYIESVSGANVNPNTWPSSSTGFDKLKTVQTYFNYATYDEEYHEIQGFTRYSKKVSGFSDNTKQFSNNALSLYYMRNSYTLTFHNVDSDAKTESVKYEAPLKSYYDYVPARPSSLDDSYEFKGWYTSPGCEDGTEVKTNGTMPAGNVIVYAKWAAKQYTVTAHGTSDKATTVDKGSTVDPSDFDSVKPEIGEDEQWVGWCLRSGEEGEYVYTPFNYATEITKDYDLYPYVISKAKYTVTYDAGEGSGTVPTDNSKYAKNAKAKLKSKGDLTGPSGKTYFLGWKSSEDGKTYQPGDKITITNDVTLTAQWGEKPADAELVYDPGTGTGSTKTVTLKNNGSEALKTSKALGFTKDGYTFIGWQYENNEGKTVIAQAGDTIHVDTDSSHANKVTALWAKVMTTDGEWEYDGTAHSTSASVEAEGGVKYTIYYKVDGSDWTNQAPTITDVGEKQVAVEARATACPTLAGTYTLKVTPKKVTFTGETATKEYNGETQELTKITEPELVSGHTYSGLTYSAKGKDAGEYDGSFSGTLVIKDAQGKDVTKNYEVTKTPGKLTITKYSKEVVVTITGNKKALTYTGAEQQVTDYTVSIDNEMYTEKDFTYSGDATAKGTNVGAYAMNLDSNDFENINNNFKNVTFKVIDGQLKITPKDVTFTGTSDSITYDGESHELTDIASDGLVSNHTFSGLTYSAKGTDVGDYAGVFSGTLVIKDTQGKDVTKNYNVTKTPGKLTINPIDEVVVTITGNTKEVAYDGTEQQVKGYTVSISNKKYTEKDFTYSGDATAKGTDVNTYAMNLNANDFKNESKNFKKVTFKIAKDGQLKVNPLKVTFTGESATKEYNGETQELTKIDNTKLASGHTYSGLTYSAKGKDAGEYAGSFSGTLVIKDAQNKDVTKNYEVTKTPGKLTITKYSKEVTVTITGNKKEVTYNGTEQSVTGYTVSIDNDLYTEEDFSFNGTAKAAGTDVDTYQMNLSEQNFKNVSNNFSNVTFKVTDGQLKVNPLKITFTGESASKEYNGETQELTKIDNTKLASGHTYAGLTYAAKGKDAGEYGGSFSGTLVIKDAQGKDVTENYEVTKPPGKLTITKYSKKVIVTISGNKKEVTYNGSEQKITGYTVSIDNKMYTEKDFTYSGNATAKGTDVDTYAMKLNADDFKNSSNNFSNVTFKIADDGQLTITPLKVTFMGESASKEYNGETQELTKITKSELASGHTYSGLTYSAKGKDAGEYAGSFSGTLVIKDTKGKDVTKNYEVTKTPGKLTITKYSKEVTVTITGNKKEVTYNGTEQKATGYTVSIDNKLYSEKNFAYSGDATAKGTDVGTYAMKLNASDFKNTSDNFSNIKFTIAKDGQLTITPLEVTFTGESGTKEYIGETQELTNITNTGLAEGHTYSRLYYSAKGKDVGKYTGSFSGYAFIRDANNQDVTKNYDIKLAPGTLEITPCETPVTVTITENSGEFTYDSIEKVVNGYTVSIDNDNYKEDDFSFHGFAVVQGTDVGTYDMEVSSGDFENNNPNFKNVIFKIVDGQLKITPATLKVVTPSAQKSYDGTPLTMEGTVSGLMGEDTVTFKTTGSQTEVGKSDNTYELVWDGTAKESNYTVEAEVGTLEVTQAVTPVEPNKPNKTKKTTKKSKAVNKEIPQTGDDSNLFLYGGAGLLALIGELYIVFTRRRRTESEE